MTDGDDEVAGGFVVINAVDHAASAEGKALAGVVLRAAGHSITEFEQTIPIEDQPMR